MLEKINTAKKRRQREMVEETKLAHLKLLADEATQQQLCLGNRKKNQK